MHVALADGAERPITENPPNVSERLAGHVFGGWAPGLPSHGWEPGITWDGKLFGPGETVEIPDDDARQFLDNGSDVEAPAKPKRDAPK